MNTRNNWSARLHAARLALSKGQKSGDRIADAYAAVQAAALALQHEIALEGAESWNESEGEEASRLVRNALKRAALAGLPALRIEITA